MKENKDLEWLREKREYIKQKITFSTLQLKRIDKEIKELEKKVSSKKVIK